MKVHSIHDPGMWDETCPAAAKEALEQFRRLRPGSHFTQFHLGDSSADHPNVACVFFAPGEVLPKHAHACHRVEVIIAGSLTWEGKVLKAGTIMTTAPNEPYGPFIAGPEGYVTLEFFDSTEKAKSAIIETPDGLKSYNVMADYAAYRDVVLNLQDGDSGKAR